MTDYSDNIRIKFPQFIKHPDIISSTNADLKYLSDSGFTKLVNNFVSRNDPDQARDILFEIWVCMMLVRTNVSDLSYEPCSSGYSPDFRCSVEGVKFDIQVKRIRNVYNEIAKTIFHRECRRRLAHHDKAWFINLRISDRFRRQHINGFFEYLKSGIGAFRAEKDFKRSSDLPYTWEVGADKLVSFSFTEKTHPLKGISLGTLYSGNPGEGWIRKIDDRPHQNAMRRVLRKAKSSFGKMASKSQSNLVIVQPDSELWMDDYDFAADILYGEDQTVVSQNLDGSDTMRDVRGPSGVLKESTFSNITGVVFIPPSVHFASKQFRGSYFLNPLHLEEICIHPKIFSDMTYYVLPEWRPDRGIRILDSGSGDP